MSKKLDLTETLQKIADTQESMKADMESLREQIVGEKEVSKGQKASEKLARFFGSWRYIISLFSIVTGWIIFDGLAPETVRFDPYPYIVLNLVLSCLASMIGPIILMSQNRADKRDRKRSIEAYKTIVNIERQVDEIHEKVEEAKNGHDK